MELEDRLRRDESLARYDKEIYPELVTLLNLPSADLGTPDAGRRAALHLCSQQLQIMEKVFLALKLDQYHAHPLNRGWINLFRRWSGTATMRLLWPSLRSMRSKDFVPFAEYQLNLSGMRLEATQAYIPLGELFGLRNLGATLSAAAAQSRLKNLFQELGQEWPMSPRELGQQAAPGKAPSMEDYSFYFRPFSHPAGVWIISHPNSNEEIWGIAVLAPHPENDRYNRLMVWVRPAYRGVTLGTKLLDAVLDHIAEARKRIEQKVGIKPEPANRVLDDPTDAREPIVVLPPLRRDKPGYGEEMAGWLRFYGRKGFVRVTGEMAQTLLKWNRPFDPAAFCLVMPEVLQRLSR
jgi:GNAT superfamily N-acetyltransferase